MKRAVEQLQREGGIGHVTVVAATADMPPGLRYLVGGRRGRFVLVSLLWMGGWMYLYLYIYIRQLTALTFFYSLYRIGPICRLCPRRALGGPRRALTRRVRRPLAARRGGDLLPVLRYNRRHIFLKKKEGKALKNQCSPIWSTNKHPPTPTHPQIPRRTRS